MTNGGDPLLTDERRHNTCLHFAALYGHSECVHKLLGSRAAYRVQVCAGVGWKSHKPKMAEEREPTERCAQRIW